MGKNTWEGRTKEHLALYKRHELKVYEDGIWPTNGKRYPHILPKALMRLNILPSFRDEFRARFDHSAIFLQGSHCRLNSHEALCFSLHRFFHHLNSSQALCFNLFFPFLLRNGERLGAIVRALGFSEQPVDGACFEFEPCRREGTNFDFMVPLDSGSRVYFEIKYTEREFGSAKDDEEHRAKFQSIYKPHTTDRFEAQFCTQTGFLKNYQILRNLWHLDLTKDDVAVFLIPRANQPIRSAENIIGSCLLERFRRRAKIVYLEDLLTHLENSLEVSNSYKEGALAEFRKKYLPA